MENQLIYWVELGSVQFTKKCVTVRMRCDVSHSVESVDLMSDFLRCRCQHCRLLHLINWVIAPIKNTLGVCFRRHWRHEFTWNIQINFPDTWLNCHGRAFLPFIANLCWKAKKLCSCCAVPGGRRNPFNALRKTTFLQFCQSFMGCLFFFIL